MATRKTDEPKEGGRRTEKVIVWLPPNQAEWLKSKKAISETVRALITEAMSLENLKLSVAKGKKKK
jgi:hypothetical protein